MAILYEEIMQGKHALFRMACNIKDIIWDITLLRSYHTIFVLGCTPTYPDGVMVVYSVDMPRAKHDQ